MIRKEKIEKLKEIIEELKAIKKEKNNVKQEDKFLQSESFKYTLNNGRVITRERLIKGNCDGSAAIIVPLVDGEFLTVIEPRVFTDLSVGIGFPAGYIESLEDAKAGALRELAEETGYVPDSIKLIDTFYQDEGCSMALNRIYLALNCKKKFEQKLDKDEIIKYMTFNYDELNYLNDMNYIMGVKTKLALEKIKKYVKER